MSKRSDELATEIERDPAKLDAAMPWYVNGTLSESDHQWVREQLEKQGRQLNLDRGISVALQNRANEVPADIAWDGLLDKVRADKQSDKSELATQHKSSGTFTRFFESILSPRLGMAMAAVLAVQAVTIGYLANERANEVQTVPVRSMSSAKEVSLIRAVFKETVTVQAVRKQLYDRGLTIVDGPNQFGEYFIYSEEAGLQDTAQKLVDSGLVERFVIDSKLMSR